MDVYYVCLWGGRLSVEDEGKSERDVCERENTRCSSCFIENERSEGKCEGKGSVLVCRRKGGTRCWTYDSGRARGV